MTQHCIRGGVYVKCGIGKGEAHVTRWGRKLQYSICVNYKDEEDNEV